MKKFLLAAAFLFVSFAGTAAAHAQTLYVNNTVPHAIWVTTYAGKSSRDTIIKAQCFAAHTTGYINASRNEDGAWVLVEFKADPNSCANHSNIAIWEKKAKGKIDTYQYNGRWVFGSN